MKLKGLSIQEDPADLISVVVDELGRIDLYNETKLVEYAWRFKLNLLSIAFQICDSGKIMKFDFSGVRNLEAFPDNGVLPEAANIEFIRFVFGMDFLEQETDTRKLKNVEFATNLVDYRFWAESLEVSVHQNSVITEV